MYWLALALWLLAAPAVAKAPDTGLHTGNSTHGHLGEKPITGGAAYPICAVTNLNDSGAGSFRDAITTCVAATGGGRVQFAASLNGYIDCASSMMLSTNNVTIDGSGGANGGVAIRYCPLSVTADNVIIRYLRLRGSSATHCGGQCEWPGLSLETGANNVVVEHSSFGFTTDQIVATWGAQKNISFMYNIIEWGSEASYDDASAATLFGLDIDLLVFWRNLVIGSTDRGFDPVPSGPRDHHMLAAENTFYDQVYFFRPGTTDVAAKLYLDMPANTFKSSPSRAGGDVETNEKMPVLARTGAENPGAVYIWGPGNQYLDGSQAWDDMYPTFDYTEYAGFSIDGNPATMPTAGCVAPQCMQRRSVPGKNWGFGSFDAATGYDAVLASAGATLPCRDAIDITAVTAVTNGTRPGTFPEDNTPPGGWPDLTQPCP